MHSIYVYFDFILIVLEMGILKDIWYT